VEYALGTDAHFIARSVLLTPIEEHGNYDTRNLLSLLLSYEITHHAGRRWSLGVITYP
jgi:hypothetical protein